MANFLKSLAILFMVCITINAKPWEEIGNGNVDIDDGSSEDIVSGNAIIQNGQIICDLVFCPSASFGCTVQTNSVQNNTKIVTTRNCTATNGTVILSNVTTTANPQSGSFVSSYNSVNKNGDATSCDLCIGSIDGSVMISNAGNNAELEDELKKKAKKYLEKVQKAAAAIKPADIAKIHSDVNKFENTLEKALLARAEAEIKARILEDTIYDAYFL